MSVATRAGALAVTAVLALGGAVAGPASADEAPETTPCAKQQAKVDKAEDALARVTAVFARQQDRVAKVRKTVKKAEAGQEKAEARRALAKAKEKRNDTKTTKRAQQQRLLKAQERLATCEAGQPTEVPTTV